MTNYSSFSDRLLKIFEDFSLTSTQFSDKIGVQKSTLSHLLSNRNKPSLDLLLKIVEHYPNLNLYWLADGRLPIYKSEKNQNATSTPSPPCSDSIDKNIGENNVLKLVENKEIDYIVILYKDGTFKQYKQPNKQ